MIHALREAELNSCRLAIEYATFLLNVQWNQVTTVNYQMQLKLAMAPILLHVL
jgi:hypothetical protein